MAVCSRNHAASTLPSGKKLTLASGLESWYGRFRAEKTLLLLQRLEPTYLSFPRRCPITVLIGSAYRKKICNCEGVEMCLCSVCHSLGFRQWLSCPSSGFAYITKALFKNLSSLWRAFTLKLIYFLSSMSINEDQCNGCLRQSQLNIGVARLCPWHLNGFRRVVITTVQITFIIIQYFYS
jgi:hypothetical protein